MAELTSIFVLPRSTKTVYTPCSGRGWTQGGGGGGVMGALNLANQPFPSPKQAREREKTVSLCNFEHFNYLAHQIMQLAIHLNKDAEHE